MNSCPRAKTLRPDVQVIMIAAYGDPETKRKALENGAEALPFSPRTQFTFKNTDPKEAEAPREEPRVGVFR